MDQISSTQLLQNSKEMSCENCECIFFKQVFTLRKVSKVLIGSPTDQIMPIPIFRCDDCGAPVMDMLPDDPTNTSEKNNKPDSGLKLIT